MLINHLPSKSLGWLSPISQLTEKDSTIEPVRDVGCLLPFGIKTHVHHKLCLSKLAPVARPLLFVGYKPLSNAARFLGLQRGCIIVSRDFTPSKVNFKYDAPDTLKKAPSALPSAVTTTTPLGQPHRCVDVTSTSPCASKHRSWQLELLPPALRPPTSNSLLSQETTLAPTPASGSVEAEAGITPTPPAARGYAYVPHYKVAPQEISSKINPLAILAYNWRGQPCREEQQEDTANLSEVVLVWEAFSDPDKKPKWLAPMAEENALFISKNTGTLVPPPVDNKVIGGMWRLVQKKNKFGKITRRKS